ncbi:MAG TPA: hypothetical protein VK048_00025 [Atopostipes sp.]|nr:hypothetical protein [Atopostipes sp.]
MKKLKSPAFWFCLTGILFIVSGCSEFTGIRQPLYDGQPVEPKTEAIEIYETSREITGAEKEYYLRHTFSDTIHQPSLDYADNEPVLLTTREYVIGEDVPAGRVSLLGNESVFTSDNYDIHPGNLVIYDEAGELYFENLFHSLYGPLVAQVDFIPGHTLEITGMDTEITAFYSAEFPEDPYVLMDLPEVIENQGFTEVQQPLAEIEEDVFMLAAGIYEVGVHLEPGTYEMTDVYAPHNTELFLFQGEDEPRVFELLLEQEVIFVEDGEPVEATEEDGEHPQIVLEDGDKIYPYYVHALVLEKVATN